MIGFVDDCNAQTTIPELPKGRQTILQVPIQQAQHKAQSWTDLLSASCGAQELSKCSCHVLQWQFLVQGDPRN